MWYPEKIQRLMIINHNKILILCSKALTPIILLFGFYIQFNGESSPGGGFQSGIILAVPFMVLIIINGHDFVSTYIISQKSCIKIGISGIYIYVLTGLASTLFGGNFLEYGVLLLNDVIGHQLGIFLIEIGVCMTIFASMLMIFISLYKYTIKNLDNK